MSKIILQPSGNKDAREHYVDTIKNNVPLDSIKSHVTSEEFEILEEIYPLGECKVWGVTPGGNNITKWNRIETGDVTLFSKEGVIYASAVTTYKLPSSSLAAHLWDYNDKGQTWEYIYFLDEVKSHNIPYKEFNRVVGYADNYIIQGFNVLDELKSRRILDAFDLDSEVYYPQISDEQFQEVVKKLEGLKETESEYTFNRRLEQAYLKKILFGNKTLDTCACCKKSYPVSFLVTAHIKKRSQCTTDERKDKNVVMPMCKFGCDDLFEQGYISVKDGKFVQIKDSPKSQDLAIKLELVVGEKCENYDQNTKRYFEWHRGHHS